MRVGLIHDTHRFVHDGRCPGRLELITFTISPERLSFYEIFDSAFASPARYVMEIFRRLHGCPEGGKFIFNPLLELNAAMIERVMSILPQMDTLLEPVVIADGENLPLGYYLPEWIEPAEERYLSLLSTVNARLDQEFLNALFCSSGFCAELGNSALEYVGNQFPYNEELWFVYEWLTRRALSLLKKLTPHPCSSLCLANRHEMTAPQKRTLRDGVKFCAVMPHHAGDALFYSIAARHTPSHIGSLVVNRRYANIVNELLPAYVMTSIDLMPPYRDGSGILQSDESFFFDFAADLAPFSFYYYCRPSRGYNRTSFHLIDHFAFALGQSFVQSEELVTRTNGAPPVYRSANGPSYRVLLHFDAGWGLKVYPKEYQKQLIAGLLKAGMEVTVLGTEDRDFGHYRSVAFKGLEPLKELLRSHHLLVGSDSFPSHYAAHVLGLPTICLFGPTKPANSDAVPSPYYKALECGMSCRPCGVLEICPQSEKFHCENFVTPPQLLQEICTMLSATYDRNEFPERCI